LSFGERLQFGIPDKKHKKAYNHPICVGYNPIVAYYKRRSIQSQTVACLKRTERDWFSKSISYASGEVAERGFLINSKSDYD
jgi:hypothetical protein